SSSCINGLHGIVKENNKPFLTFIFTLPEINPSGYDSFQVFMNPQFFSGTGVNRNNGVVSTHYIHDIIYNNGVEIIIGVIIGGHDKCDLQLVYIFLGDLGKINIL